MTVTEEEDVKEKEAGKSRVIKMREREKNSTVKTKGKKTKEEVTWEEMIKRNTDKSEGR